MTALDPAAPRATCQGPRHCPHRLGGGGLRVGVPAKVSSAAGGMDGPGRGRARTRKDVSVRLGALAWSWANNMRCNPPQLAIPGPREGTKANLPILRVPPCAHPSEPGDGRWPPRHYLPAIFNPARFGWACLPGTHAPDHGRTAVMRWGAAGGAVQTGRS